MRRLSGPAVSKLAESFQHPPGLHHRQIDPSPAGAKLTTGLGVPRKMGDLSGGIWEAHSRGRGRLIMGTGGVKSNVTRRWNKGKKGREFCSVQKRINKK